MLPAQNCVHILRSLLYQMSFVPQSPVYSVRLAVFASQLLQKDSSLMCDLMFRDNAVQMILFALINNLF